MSSNHTQKLLSNATIAIGLLLRQNWHGKNVQTEKIGTNIYQHYYIII
jgi:hypothetical protein